VAQALISAPHAKSAKDAKDAKKKERMQGWKGWKYFPREVSDLATTKISFRSAFAFFALFA
jgi:hypothetical protein